MGLIDRTKILAEIAKLGAEAYALLVDKSRTRHEREARIKQLEAEVAELKKRIGAP